jgi:hypothetical protein
MGGACRACGYGGLLAEPVRRSSSSEAGGRGVVGFRVLVGLGVLTALGFGGAVARILGATSDATIEQATPAPGVEEAEAPAAPVVPFADPDHLPAPGPAPPARSYNAIQPPVLPRVEPQVRPLPLPPSLSADAAAAAPVEVDRVPDPGVEMTVRAAGLAADARARKRAFTDEDLARIARERARETLATTGDEPAVIPAEPVAEEPPPPPEGR